MNIIDLQFYRLAEEISALSRGALYEKMRRSFDGLSPDIRNRLSVYFGKFGFWGKLDPANGVFEEIELKADELHNHIDDFVWLYGRLADFRSKKTLYAVLNNWYAYDFKTTTQVKEYAFDEYFDHDIIPDAHDEVFVDLGAYFGESTLSFVLNYGKETDGVVIKENMVIAIEPMINAGRKEVAILRDGWGVVTRDGKPAAHYENTVLFTAKGVEVLTLEKDDEYYPR